MKDSKLRLGAQKYCFGDQTLFAYNLKAASLSSEYT